MASLYLAFLGPFTVIYDGRVITNFRTRSVQALLAYLAVEEIDPRPHQREVLAELLWPGYPPGSARKNLRQALYELGRLIPQVDIVAGPPEPLTLSTRETLRLNSDSHFELDTAKFTRLIQDGSSEALARAVDLYRGDFLQDFVLPDSGEFEIWTETWRSRFRREALEAMDHLAAIALEQHDYVRAESFARRQLALDDLRESAVMQLMLALVGQGQRSAALLAYDEVRQRLQEELDVAPGTELSELWEQIRIGGIHPGPTITTPVPDTKPASNLPTPVTPFIGRRTEVEQVKDLLKKPDLHLLTLIGPGGIGKTRLSIQSVSEMREVFPDGVYFAPLSSVQSADGFISALAQAVNFSFYRDEQRRQQLLDYLRERRLLLVLDNPEHLPEASVLVGEIMTNATGVKLVVTSRIRLNVQGEQLYPVGGMRFPDTYEVAAWDNPGEQAKPFSAVQLFIERARSVQPDFQLTSENAGSVMEISRLVHGMPLGIELASAWVELLPPDEIAAEIVRSLDFLGTDESGVPDRQRSLRAVFESSWKLLSEEEQKAFLRLCVLVGSFSREAAQEISGASLRTLLGLANKSFLQQSDNGRFQLHELMCQYGNERLNAMESEWQEAHDRHAAYFSGFVAIQSIRMQGAEQLAGMSAVEDEFNTNIRTAWDWFVAEQRWDVITDQMALGLFQYGTIREQLDELIPWLREARLRLELESGSEERIAFFILGTLEVHCELRVGIEDANPVERLETIWQSVNEHNLVELMGFWYVILVGMVQARKLDPDIEHQMDTTIAKFREQNNLWMLATGLLIKSKWWSVPQGGYLFEAEKDETYILEAEQIFNKLGVIYEQYVVSIMLGVAAMRRNSLAEVALHFQQAKQFLDKMGDQYHSIYFLTWVWIYFHRGQREQGFSFLHEEQRIFARLGNQHSLAFCLHLESLFAVRYSTFEHAQKLCLEALELVRKLDIQSNIAWWTYELAEIYRVFGDQEEALNLYERARMRFEELNMTLGLGYWERARGDIALEEGRYSDALANYQAFEVQASRENNAWSMKQAHAKLALTLAYLEKEEQAHHELQLALSESFDTDLIILSLLAEPVCLMHEGKNEQAVEIASFIAQHPASWNETTQHAHRIVEIASRDLEQEVLQAAIERGKGLDLDLVVKALTKSI